VANDAPKVLIAGASGFAGAIAARLIQEHPVFALGPITARAEAGQRLMELYPQHRVGAVLEELDIERMAGEVDAAIVGYPHAAAAPVVKALLNGGVKVIDLSADFRLTDLATYETWYGEHPAPNCSAPVSTASPSSTASGLPARSWSLALAAFRRRRCSASRRWPPVACWPT
jgi:N-acetyl-gamma-glutamyl-phosphate reductase